MNDPVSPILNSVTPPWLVQWAPVFSAAAVFVVGAIGVAIAFQQWQTARTKVQLDLYEKRRPIYDAVIAFVGDVLTVGVPTYTRTIELAQQTQGSTFIFGPEIGNYICELERQGDGMRAAEVKLAALPLGLERASLEQIITERQVWFQAQFSVVERLFRPYLQLESRRVKIWSRWRGRDRNPPGQNLV